MFLHINPHNGLAIYDQVVRQVKFAVANGTLRTGELVPSVRELARELAINPNTIARAYRQLQADQVLEPVRGTGLEVASGAAERCRHDRLELIRTRLRRHWPRPDKASYRPRSCAGWSRRNFRKFNKRRNSCSRSFNFAGSPSSIGAQRALDDVSLEVPAGVVFALLGENGAGKTTAIRTLLGTLTARPGEGHGTRTRQLAPGARSCAVESGTWPSGPRSTSG